MAAKKLLINCNSLLQQTVSDKKKRTAYSKVLKSPSVRQEFGRRLVDVINERTLSGKDKNNERFKKYSDSYKRSLVFQIYKSGETVVNLRLTGEMLSSMEAKPKNSYDVELFFIGESNNEKATWHIEGTKNMPKRDFFGVSLDDQKKILKDVIKDFNDQTFDFEIAANEGFVHSTFDLIDIEDTGE